jgi:hypothetical protein
VSHLLCLPLSPLRVSTSDSPLRPTVPLPSVPPFLIILL